MHIWIEKTPSMLHDSFCFSSCSMHLHTLQIVHSIDHIIIDHSDRWGWQNLSMSKRVVGSCCHSNRLTFLLRHVGSMRTQLVSQFTSTETIWLSSTKWIQKVDGHLCSPSFQM